MITALIDGQLQLVDEALLTPNHSTIDNENELTHITEYLLNGEVVHRSAHVQLKKGFAIEGILGNLT